MIEGKIYCDICGCYIKIHSLELPKNWVEIDNNKHACHMCYSRWVIKNQNDNDPGPSD